MTLPATAPSLAHWPNGQLGSLNGPGGGGPSRHLCGGCGRPIVSSYDIWVDALTRSAACPGGTS